MKTCIIVQSIAIICLSFTVFFQQKVNKTQQSINNQLLEADKKFEKVNQRQAIINSTFLIRDAEK